MKTKQLIDEAKEQARLVKQIVMDLLKEPMNENQKELVLNLYRLVK